MMLPLFAALALLADGPPARFDAAELAQRNAPGDATEIAAALARAEAIRAALVVNPVDAPALLDPMEARALELALGRLDPASAPQIAYFLHGAVTRIAVGGGGPVAGYYNPLLDLWLVAPLERIGGSWRIATARMVDGAAMREGGAYWGDAPSQPIASLVANHQASILGFDRRFGGFERAADLGDDAFALLDERSGQWMTSLAAWRQDAAALAAADRVRRLIHDGTLARAGAGDADIATQIDALPAATRRTMSIAGAVRHGDAVSLFLISPLAPDLIVLLDLDAADTPAGLIVVNLANASATGSPS